MPNEDGYNKIFSCCESLNGEMFDTITIDQLISALTAAKDVLGGNCIVAMAYDGGAGYDSIRTIHGEDFQDNLICVLSCCSGLGSHADIDPIKPALFCRLCK